MNTIKITVPIPSNKLSPHAKGHWRAKSALTKKTREAARLMALVALDGRTPPMWSLTTASMVGYFPSRCRWDHFNLIGAMKPTLDGIADAGIVENDRWLRPGTFDFDRIDKANPRIEIILTKMPD